MGEHTQNSLSIRAICIPDIEDDPVIMNRYETSLSKRVFVGNLELRRTMKKRLRTLLSLSSQFVAEIQDSQKNREA